MTSLTLGRRRALQASSTPAGHFCILAIDHRDALRARLNPDNPDSVSDEAMTSFKLSVLDSLSNLPSAVLLDPVYSAPQAIAEDRLPGNLGLISAIEEQGYLGDPFSRQTTMLNGWGIEKAKRLGANGVKVLLFYNPDAGLAAERQEALVEALLADCHRYDVPLFLEPIVYSLDADVAKNSQAFADQRADLIIRSAERFSQLGVDVLKVEFPIDAQFNVHQDDWQEACQKLDSICSVPWVLLSAGVSFEVFEQQVEVACTAGCSGFMVGRSVWGEAVNLEETERSDFLTNDAATRLQRLIDIASTSGTSWQEIYPTSPVDAAWYASY